MSNTSRKRAGNLAFVLQPKKQAEGNVLITAGERERIRVLAINYANSYRQLRVGVPGNRLCQMVKVGLGFLVF